MLHKAPMSIFHNFVMPKNLHWTNINAITLGLNNNKSETLIMLNEMKQLALDHNKNIIKI